ncbi:MAG: Gfo/Idh/MocA family oxidoreductase [Planctomycetota bacterium]
MSSTTSPTTPSAGPKPAAAVRVEADRFDGRTLRCATIGVGRMGQHHARVYTEIEGCRLVGVVDADEARASEIAARHDAKPLPNVEALLAEGVDAVTVATPTTHHRAVAEPLLEAGVACLIEKPLAEDAETARHLADVAERTGTPLMVGHIERFNPVMRAVQKATDAGFEISPRFIEVHRVSPMTFRSVDISVVMDMMIHDLDVVLMLMGGREPDEIDASGVALVTKHADLCNARLTWRLPDGGRCVANVTASRLALKTERVTRITGEHAYLKVDYAEKAGVLIRRTANEIQMREVQEQLRQGQDLTTLNWHELVNFEPLQIDDAEPLKMEIGSFIHAVRTGTRPPIDATAGFANVRTAERILQAIEETA